MAMTSSNSLSEEVSMRMGTELLPRMSRQMECPSAPGSFRSSTMQSGSAARARAAVSPQVPS